MTANEHIRYRKLPGRRRGIFQGSSVWQAPDHLLLVRSWRVREEYKRFYLGDIQSIAIASAPRFHISTRSLTIGFFWSILLAISTTMPRDWPAWIMLGIGLALAGAWVYISAKCSCVCRIYTAVSGDDLPSVYRTWTARKFVKQVEAQITGAQGAINDGWQDAVDARRIGPPEQADVRMPGTSLEGVASNALAAGVSSAETRTLPLSEIFVVLMFIDAIYSFATRLSTARWHVWVGYGILAVELAVSIAMLVQHNRGKLRAGMQKLVLAMILISGGMWYSRSFIAGITGAVNARAGKAPIIGVTQVNGATRDFDIGAHVLWGLIGTGILLIQREKRPRGIMGA